MEKLTEARMGEIALAMLTKQISENIPTAEALKRELPNESKKLGISKDELQAFATAILPKAIALRLNCSSVSLTFREM